MAVTGCQGDFFMPIRRKQMFKLAESQFKQLHRQESYARLDGDQRKVSVIKDLKLSVKSHVFLTEMNQRFHRHSATDHPLT